MTRKIAEAREAIANSSPDSAVYIGCDSKRFKKNGKWHARYATVVVLHKAMQHGCTIFYDVVEMPDYGSIKQRMLNEVAFAIQHASDLIDVIGDRKFEIHLDINPSPTHKSNVALGEAMGYVLGTFGFEPKIKPYSFAATYAADHIVKL